MPAVSFEKGCMINNFNAFIIGPAGEIYKCWNEFNHPEKIIGYISSKEFTNKTLFLQSITESDIFNDQECKDCLTFPTCKGKCGYYNLRNKYEHGRYTECPAYKDTHLLEEALLLTLDKKDEIKNKPKLYI